MRVIIAGSRDTKRALERIDIAVRESGFEITEVVSGMSGNVDLLALHWGEIHKIPVKKFFANWAKYGRSAGPIRNRRMAENADALIAIWDGKSRGTRNMINEAKRKGLKVHILKTNDLST